MNAFENGRIEKVIDFSKSVYELGKDNPEFLKILAEAGFADILKPGMLTTTGRFPKGAKMKRIALVTVEELFRQNGYTVRREL